MPSGDQVWVSVGSPGPDRNGDEIARGVQDVALGDAATALIQAGQLPGFTETVRGVVSSVRQAFDHWAPDTVDVEFGIQISARTGGVMSVLAAAGGAAHVKVTASWGRESSPPQATRPDAGGGT